MSDKTNSNVRLPRELVERIIERLNTAQIFPLASELRKACAASPAPASAQDGQGGLTEQDRQVIRDAIDLLEACGCRAVPDGLRAIIAHQSTLGSAPQAEHVGYLTISGTGNYIMTRAHTATDRALKEGNYQLYLAAPQGQAAERSRTKLREMRNEEGELGWYFDCDGHYIDVERDAAGNFSIYFKDRRDGKDGWLDQAERAAVPEGLRDALDRLRHALQMATPSIDQIHEVGADGPLEEAWQIYYDEVMPMLYRAPVAQEGKAVDGGERRKCRQCDATTNADNPVELCPGCEAPAAQQDSAECWSCKRPYTAEQRADADGNCPHCGVEIELDEQDSAQVAGKDGAA